MWEVGFSLTTHFLPGWHKPSRWCVAMTWDRVSLHCSVRANFKPSEVYHSEILTSTNNAAYCWPTNTFLWDLRQRQSASRFVLASLHWWQRCLCWRQERVTRVFPTKADERLSVVHPGKRLPIAVDYLVVKRHPILQVDIVGVSWFVLTCADELDAGVCLKGHKQSS